MKNKIWINAAKAQIDKHQIISFDIFDTLLLRPYIKPTDLFLHIEKELGHVGFTYVRTLAEKEARQKHPNQEEVTFDQIYAEIDEVFFSLKQTELDWEKELLLPNPEMKEVWDYAVQGGKKIIVATDMYLSEEFLAMVLAKNDFANYEKLYVSNKIGKTKATGTLFPHIIHDIGCNPADILHIGDNIHSDYKNAKKSGITPIYYEQLISSFVKHSKRNKAFKNSKGYFLGGSILTMLMAMHWQKEQLGIIEKSNYFNSIGYEYGGPVI